jgi:drug/metabolite transporter (DMT)-like permease
MSSTLRKGIYFAFLTALISGVSNFVNKIAVDVIKPPLVFTAEKNAFVGLLIIGALIATWKWQKIKKLNRKQVIYLLLIGIIGGSLPFYLFFTGLSQIPAINGAIINKTLVIWVAILAIPFLKEKMSPLLMIAVAFLFYANLIIGGFAKFQFSQGELFVLLATILWAVEHVLAKKILPTVDPDIVTAARMGFGSLILLGAAAIMAPAALVKGFMPSQTQFFWMLATVALLRGRIGFGQRDIDNQCPFGNFCNSCLEFGFRNSGLLYGCRSGYSVDSNFKNKRKSQPQTLPSIIFYLNLF